MSDAVSSIVDPDPIETREWLDALASLMKYGREDRTHYMIHRLLEAAGDSGVSFEGGLATYHRNTLSSGKEPDYPGDLALERKIRSAVRWNSVAMVVRANAKDKSLGGYLASYTLPRAIVPICPARSNRRRRPEPIPSECPFFVMTDTKMIVPSGRILYVDRYGIKLLKDNRMIPSASMNVEPLSGFGSVTDVPRLPPGFTDTFRSYRVDTGKIGLHAVIGGSGEALLLHAGWPQSWFTWRYVMLPLAKHYTVIAVDPRGLGISSKPADGFDVDTLATDMFDMMDVLGHDSFVMMGHDAGVMIGYAMAAAQPQRIRRLVLGEGLIPGATTEPPLIPDDRRQADLLWHFAYNRALDVNERLVEGREDIYFRYQFATKAASPDAVPAYGVDFHIELLRRVPGTLKASFDYYRSIDQTIPQIRRHMEKKISVPVLAIGGEHACGPMVENEQRDLATDVESLIIPDCGHWLAEEKPEALLAALEDFFAKK